MKDLFEQYREYLLSSIDEEGIKVPPAFILGEDDKLTVMALAVGPEEAYMTIMGQMKERPKEVIFALDRFTREGQGTTLQDAMVGFHFRDGVFNPFVIEYQHDPRIVKDPEWDNEFWNSVVTRELSGFGLLQESNTEAPSAKPN